VIRRILSLLLVLWAFGFLWFAVALPQPAAGEKTDAIVVPTGGSGRIARGLQMLRDGAAERMLVSGVDSDVKPHEFAVEYDVPAETMECCVTLGFAALDTRGNARETSNWVVESKVHSLRLVTSDWHMRRATLELESVLPEGTVVIRDAVRTEPSLRTLFLEYHKLLAAWLVRLLPG
jgi:uncharacterized SAM-binding protein YcdF (DUF218 family)